jgi:hypothetical protein
VADFFDSGGPDKPSASSSALAGQIPHVPSITSLTPSTLPEVAATFQQVADVCGVPQRGVKLVSEFEAKLEAVRRATAGFGPLSLRPSVLFLEWLDPVFDGGHWIPEMLAVAGCVDALQEEAPKGTKDGTKEEAPQGKGSKSVERSWDEVIASDPDVVIVACCGFGLQRNTDDAWQYADRIGQLRAARLGQVFAVDANRYFARPSPALAEGTAILARCAHANNAAVVDRVSAIGFLPEYGFSWEKVDLSLLDDSMTSAADPVALQASQEESRWQAAHAEACADGKNVYVDPTSCYTVFTRLAHEKRGKCCGSRCRLSPRRCG